MEKSHLEKSKNVTEFWDWKIRIPENSFATSDRIFMLEEVKDLLPEYGIWIWIIFPRWYHSELAKILIDFMKFSCKPGWLIR